VLLSHLNFAWRVIGTGLAFAGFLGGGFTLAVFAFPAIDFFTRDKKLRRERHHALIRWAFQLFIGVLTRLGIMTVRLEKIAALSQSKGTIVVANHPSLIDVVLISAAIPRVQCIVKRELWSSPFLGPVMRGNGYIPADLEPEALLVACREALADGRSLIVFPEGTRTRPGEPVRFHRGFAHIATLLEADIQLLLITCTPPTLTKGEKWWEIPAHRPVFQVSPVGRLDAKSWQGNAYRSVTVRDIVRRLERFYNERLVGGSAGD
jgi:1-acyl-sn-glycerol-3-phosphate acyltransferase